MLEIRISNYKPDGTEVKTVWTLDPLKDKAYPFIKREEGNSSNGTTMRRPYYEQTVRQITFGASALVDPANQDNFSRLIRSHKIEFVTGTKGKNKIYTEFALDAEAEISFDYLEDVIELAFKELKFIEKFPRWFDAWYPKG